MEDRGNLSDIWGEDDGDSEREEEEESGDKSRDNAPIPTLGAFERMQRAQVETIVNFTPAPPQAAKRGRNGGPAPASSVAIYTQPMETVSLVEQHRLEYNRNFNARRDEWLDTTEESADMEPERGGNDGEEEEEPETATAPSSPGHDDDDDDIAANCQSCGRQNPRPVRPPKKRQRVAEATTAAGEFDVLCRPECLLCSHGKEGIDAEHVTNLKYLLKENIGVRSDIELARMIHLYYKQKIYPGSGLPMLSTASVLDHIQNMHSKNARMFISAQIDDEAMMYRLFKNRVWRTDGSWDERALKEYRASKRELRLLFSMRQDKMNFNEGAAAEDQSREAKFMQLTAHFYKEQERGQGNGKKKKATTPFRI